MNERLSTRVGRKYGGEATLRSVVRAVYLMHDTRLLFVSLWPIFNSSPLPSNREPMSAPRPPRPKTPTYLSKAASPSNGAVMSDRTNGGGAAGGGRAVTTCP